MTNEELQSENEMSPAEKSPARKKLELLESTGKYVFHGTTERLDELEPRQAYTGDPVTHETYADGTPAVAASPDADTSIFRSILSRKNLTENIPFKTQWIHDQNGTPLFSANQEALNAIRDKVGYVLVFDRSEFQPYEINQHEWRSDHKVKPVDIIEVSAEDLPEKITIID